jgi:hypothetical protein
MPPPTLRATFLLTLLLAGCDTSEQPSVSCGIAAMTGPLVVLEAFGRGSALDAAPDAVPAALPVRLVAGPVLRGIVGKSDSTGWVVGAEGDMPENAATGYGVLIVHDRIARGVLVFDGQPVRGAAVIGSVALGDTIIPMLGVRVDPAAIADSACPVFPDSAR